MVGLIMVKLGVEVGLSPSPSHIVLDGDPAPLLKGAQPFNFLHMSVVAKRLVGSRYHLVTEVGIGPGDIVLDGDPSLPKTGDSSPHFSAHVMWPNGWMDQDAI